MQNSLENEAGDLCLREKRMWTVNAMKFAQVNKKACCVVLISYLSGVIKLGMHVLNSD